MLYLSTTANSRLSVDHGMPLLHLTMASFLVFATSQFLITYSIQNGLGIMQCVLGNKLVYTMCLLNFISLVPRPLPNFISQLWRKIDWEWLGNEDRTLANLVYHNNLLFLEKLHQATRKLYMAQSSLSLQVACVCAWLHSNHIL